MPKAWCVLYQRQPASTSSHSRITTLDKCKSIEGYMTFSAGLCVSPLNPSSAVWRLPWRRSWLSLDKSPTIWRHQQIACKRVKWLSLFFFYVHFSLVEKINKAPSGRPTEKRQCGQTTKHLSYAPGQHLLFHPAQIGKSFLDCLRLLVVDCSVMACK